MSNLASEVQNEVDALHRFFVGWFTGAIPLDALEAEVLARFDRDFRLISPTGDCLTLEELQAALRGSHAANPGLRISIRNVKVHRVLDSHVLATYEEWQQNAPGSAQSDSARISTVLFHRSQSLRWLHVHETWLPE